MARKFNIIIMYKTCLVIFSLLLFTSAKAQYTFFRPGSYYTPAGEKVTGLLYWTPNKNHILFKKDQDAHYEKIKIDDLKAVVIPGVVDSLVVLTEDDKDDKKYFGKFMSATPVTTFYYKIRENTYSGMPNAPLGGAVGMSPGHTEIKLIPMYLDGTTTHELTKKNYIDVLSKALADDAGLVQKIQNNEFKFKELNAIFDEYSQESTYLKKK